MGPKNNENQYAAFVKPTWSRSASTRVCGSVESIKEARLYFRRCDASNSLHYNRFYRDRGFTVKKVLFNLFGLEDEQ